MAKKKRLKRPPRVTVPEHHPTHWRNAELHPGSGYRRTREARHGRGMAFLLYMSRCNLYLTQLMFLISCKTVAVWLAEAVPLWEVANVIKHFGNTGIFSLPFRHTAVCFKRYPAMEVEFS